MSTDLSFIEEEETTTHQSYDDYDDFQEPVRRCVTAYPVQVTSDGFGFFKKKTKSETDVTKPTIFAEDIIRRYTFKHVTGITIQVINYGATVTSICTKDKNNVVDDIVLGFENAAGYYEHEYFGSTMGRVTGVLSNSEFVLGDNIYHLSQNWNDFHFNGGNHGFDKVLWDSYQKNHKVIMTHVTSDGSEGYPGTLTVQITFEMTMEGDFRVETTARTSQPTPVNISHHIFFNLAGHWTGEKGLKEHCLVINANSILKKNEDGVTYTGQEEEVGGTYCDFRLPRRLKNGISKISGGGYDHSFVLMKTKKDEPSFAARLIHPERGRFVEIYTNHQILHFYTSNNFPIRRHQRIKLYVPPPPPQEVTKSESKKSVPRISVQHRDPAMKPPGDDEAWLTRMKEILYSYTNKTAPKPKRSTILEYTYNYKDSSPKQLSDVKSVLSKESSEWTNRGTAYERYRMSGLDCGDLQEFFSDPVEAASDMISLNEPYEKQFAYEIQGKRGTSYWRHGGCCIFPCGHPDAINVPSFPSDILRPGETYSRVTIYKFGVMPKRKTYGVLPKT